jgi:hypothetical protein
MPFCSRCGREIPLGNKFCTYCGTPIIATISTKEELLRSAMRALDHGDTELARKFMDQAKAASGPTPPPPAIPSIPTKKLLISRQIALLILAFTFSLVSYSLPWSKGNGEIFTGWQCTFPFGFPYLIGLVLSGLSFLLSRRRTILNVLAGIFVIFGTLGNLGLIAVGEIVAGLAGKRVVPAYGVGLGFLSGLILIIAGVLQRIGEKE